ncbi:MAG: YdcH family protein [Hyphomicrobiaceae bacterium]
MAVSAHLAELTERHRMLEKKLEEALLHPSVDTLEISQLKREKLQLKDAMARLKNGRTEH